MKKKLKQKKIRKVKKMNLNKEKLYLDELLNEMWERILAYRAS